jgi:hypothetical protein
MVGRPSLKVFTPVRQYERLINRRRTGVNKIIMNHRLELRLLQVMNPLFTELHVLLMLIRFTSKPLFASNTKILLLGGPCLSFTYTQALSRSRRIQTYPHKSELLNGSVFEHYVFPLQEM